MKRVLFALVFLFLVCAPALAGPNSDGAIIVHTNDAYDYLSTTICSTPLGQPSSCEEAITRTDLSISVVWFLAAFPPGAIPAVSMIYFGVNFDVANLDASAFGPCGPAGTLEIRDPGWPANEAGCSIGFGTPIVGETLFRFYYFKVDDFLGSAGPYFCSAINPTGGYGSFFDNSFPPLEDSITQFGCVNWYQPGYNACPQTLPTAVCCSPVTGDCIVSTQSGCQAPSIWHPEWTTCSPNPCPLPMAVCCMADGACTTVLEADCLAPGVWHPEWTVCSPNPCPQPTAACCAPTGACTITTQASCQSPRIWHPEWATCTPNPCPPPEVAACCAPTGACTITTQANCHAPRVWHPEWTSCLPNPCPFPLGACCATNGSCTITTQANCIPPSTWHSELTSCTPNFCPQPMGACCAPSGSCVIRSQSNCLPPSVWHAEWTSCSPNPCPMPQGACCHPITGECAYVVSSQCQPPLVWHSEWTSCSPNPCPSPYGPNANGAIIVHTNDAYDYLSTTICSTPLGQPATCTEAITRTDRSTGAVIWFLAAFLPSMNPEVASVYFGIDYDEASLDATVGYGPCGPTGTIQLPDAGWPSNSTGNTVVFGSPIIGNVLFRFYYFRVDDSSGAPGPFLCSAVNPTGGYAAFFDGSFPPLQDDINLFGCVRWYAEGQNPCPIAPAPGGACCDPVTATCAMTTWGGCPAPWVWLGEGTLCVPNNCPLPLGACCFVHGECEFLTQAACLAAVDHVGWLGYGTSCTPTSPCEQPGACCNLSSGACTFTHPDLCQPPLHFVGEGVQCLPNDQCPELGACCDSNGNCTYVVVTDCAPPGVWHPEWSCEPNYCPPPVPTERTTWGKIKASFR